MYHSISDREQRARHPYFRTATDKRCFGNQLKWLHDSGYQSAGLSDVVGGRLAPGGADEKRVVITFDDGLQDFYTEAFPLLERYGYSATMFLPTAYIGTDAGPFHGAQCLTWTQVRELSGKGIHFGSHTVTHPQLTELKGKDIQEEVRRSKETIEEKLGARVESFAYPYAFPATDRDFKQRLQAMLEEARYENGVCTSIGTSDAGSQRFFLPRLPVNSCDDPRLFKAKLEGGYDWLGALQYATKLFSGGATAESRP
jgi:peptidoglycan/xylan/chitin deacetylase (PgdA/CDA1 family)